MCDAENFEFKFLESENEAGFQKRCYKFVLFQDTYHFYRDNILKNANLSSRHFFQHHEAFELAKELGTASNSVH